MAGMQLTAVVAGQATITSTTFHLTGFFRLKIVSVGPASTPSELHAVSLSRIERPAWNACTTGTYILRLATDITRLAATCRAINRHRYVCYNKAEDNTQVTTTLENGRVVDWFQSLTTTALFAGFLCRKVVGVTSTSAVRELHTPALTGVESPYSCVGIAWPTLKRQLTGLCTRR